MQSYIEAILEDENDSVPFSQLKSIDDNHGVVWMACDASAADVPAINDFFHKAGFLKSGRVTGVKQITGNTLGDKGRHDILITLEDAKINPIARLRIKDLKWISDFIVNYAEDYGVEADEPEDDDPEVKR